MARRAELEGRFPTRDFLGVKHGRSWPRYYRAADVFVFPSRTDTFGLVMLEAMACGMPVAAYPVTGPIDVIGNCEAGVLRNDLAEAALAALQLDRDAVRRHALRYSWAVATQQFLSNLEPRPRAPAAPTATDAAG